MEEIKRFRVLGHEIFGIIHVPDQKEKKVGVVLLCPGHQYRVGPHRMYVKLARCLENEGYHVLRVDSEGIGDSTGGFSDEYLHEVHARIQRGKFIKSSSWIIRQYRKEYGLKKVVVSGLCGGSLTGLLVSRCCRAVDAVVGLGLPFKFIDVQDPISGPAATNELQKKGASAPVRESLFQVYLRKTLDLDAWKRALFLRSDYRLIINALKHAFQMKVLRRNPTIIYKAIDALFKLFDSDRPVLLIYSGNDFHYQNFQAIVEQNAKLKE